MKTEEVMPVARKLARELTIAEAVVVSGGDTVGTTHKGGPAGKVQPIETLSESGSGPDTVNGTPGTGEWTETYGG